MTLQDIYLTKQISVNQLVWRNDPAIWRWCRQNHMLSAEHQYDWEQKIHEDPTIEMFGIKRFLDSDIPAMGNDDLGTCGLTSIRPEHGTAEFSLFIAPEQMGNGYGKAALVHLLDYGFNRLGLNCIWGEVLEGNPALKMFESVGFHVMESMCRQRYFKEGKYWGSNQCDILAYEFNEIWGDELKKCQTS